MPRPRNIITLDACVARDPARRMVSPIDFTLAEGEHIAVIGGNGSGKTTLVETITGALFLKEGHISYDFSGGHGAEDNSAYRNIRYMTFRDAYGAADRGYYYQQRWNASDSEDAPLTRDTLAGEECDPALRRELFDSLGITPLLDKRIIMLSSGELRRTHIAKALMSQPRVLIIDNPFIGLDPPTREVLGGLLERLSRRDGLSIILVLSSSGDIPSFVTHVYTVKDMVCGPKLTSGEFFATETFTSRREALRRSYSAKPPALPPLTTPPLETESVAILRNISISYGSRTLFGGLDWTILPGEKWVLTGSNGSGKSTLLSLITADNPRAYSQDITLFGRRRGTGESIWDIKRRIGYVSPEMHRSYVSNIPAIEIVASGFFDSIGLYHRADDSQREVCRAWIRSFGIEHLADKPFLKLSSGEQRLLLLARAFVKDPDLLILDEPLHGLDGPGKELARAVIEEFCRREGKSMIYVTHYREETPSCVTLEKRL